MVRTRLNSMFDDGEFFELSNKKNNVIQVQPKMPPKTLSIVTGRGREYFDNIKPKNSRIRKRSKSQSVSHKVQTADGGLLITNPRQIACFEQPTEIPVAPQPHQTPTGGDAHLLVEIPDTKMFPRDIAGASSNKPNERSICDTATIFNEYGCCARRSNAPEDVCDTYGKYIAKQIMGLGAKSQILVRMEIMKALTRAALEELKNQ